MLRVTVNKGGLLESWELEGKLAGEWVIELERCWKERPLEPATAMQLNLKAVTFIDAAGKQLLTDMHGAGVEIRGCGCMTKAVVEEIMRETGIR
jgi:anti-anti-sigma regulatory factor